MSLPINYLDLNTRNIVIVEDDVPSIKYYETLLKNSGATLNIFCNGKSFIDYITKTDDKIDIVLMDFLIPFVNGIECTKILRKERKNVPVLMITAYFTDNTKNEAYIAGCSEYILKPVFPEKIFSLLEKYLDPRFMYSNSL